MHFENHKAEYMPEKIYKDNTDEVSQDTGHTSKTASLT